MASYPIEVFWSDEDEGYIAIAPDLTGASAWGETEAEAIEELHTVRANIDWQDIGSLFRGLGAEIEEAEGSRVAVLLNGRVAVFHRLHPQKEASEAAVRSVRRFLENAGVQP